MLDRILVARYSFFNHLPRLSILRIPRGGVVGTEFGFEINPVLVPFELKPTAYRGYGRRGGQVRIRRCGLEQEADRIAHGRQRYGFCVVCVPTVRESS